MLQRLQRANQCIINDTDGRENVFCSRIIRTQDNDLSGIIGAQFGKLQFLQRLYLENNALRGGVEALPWLSSLEHVALENNQITGTIPYDLGKLHRLEEVRLGRNRLRGTIPGSLLRSHTLRKLDLHDNDLTGEITIHEASVLQYVYLHSNRLTGPLFPSDVCSVAETLIDLRLNNNTFLGKFPDVGCSMERLELLSLADNELTGPIPDALPASMPRIRELHLYGNRLVSTIPEALFRLENLTALLLGDNELTGAYNSAGFIAQDCIFSTHVFLSRVCRKPQC